MTNLKARLGSILPATLVHWIRVQRGRAIDRKLASMDTREIFNHIYAEKLWGANPDSTVPYSSGSGSHDPSIVEPYVKAVREYLLDRNHKTAVDIGCGDFNVGRRIADLFSEYWACDIVSSVVESNSRRYPLPNVKFLALDATIASIPQAEVVFVRQVLQHLSNSAIAGFLAQLAKNTEARVLIVTEHVPADPNHVPNVDKPTGGGTRATSLKPASGVLLEAAPFHLAFKRRKEICSVEQYGARIVTVAYEL